MSKASWGKATLLYGALLALATATTGCEHFQSDSQRYETERQSETRTETTVGTTVEGNRSSANPAPESDSGDVIPAPMREFRGVWVATVANIDWPSNRNLSTQQQQDEVIAILDKTRELNMNAVVLQVRPSADAIYPSELEPWSEYLTGTQGKAPEPFYDPLEFWVRESHARGIEVHAWFNPYRVKHPNQKSPLVEPSLGVTRPDLVKSLAEGYLWMDPAEPDVQKFSLDVVLDVVRRYDIDGVHFDDYFYPYASYNKGADFPDDESWGRYQAAGGKLSRGDWRRKAVNDFVRSIHEEVRKLKPHVKFGMSPFGIWRPGHPASIAGMDQYDQLYADAKLWLNEGWVDYYTPQLYWPIRQVPQSFPVLLAWWKEQNTKNVNLWPGLGTYRLEEAGKEEKVWGGTEEVLNQIMITRALVPEGPGHVHFSMIHFMNNRHNINEALTKTIYAKPALIPPSPWIDDKAPAAPTVKAARTENGEVKVSWQDNAKEDVFYYVVYRREGTTWSYDIVGRTTRDLVIAAPEEEVTTQDNIQGGTQQQKKAAMPVTKVAVSAVDRNGNESRRSVVTVE